MWRSSFFCTWKMMVPGMFWSCQQLGHLFHRIAVFKLSPLLPEKVVQPLPSTEMFLNRYESWESFTQALLKKIIICLMYCISTVQGIIAWISQRAGLSAKLVMQPSRYWETWLHYFFFFTIVQCYCPKLFLRLVIYRLMWPWYIDLC